MFDFNKISIENRKGMCYNIDWQLIFRIIN